MQEREEPSERRLRAAGALFVVVLGLLIIGFASAAVNADFNAVPDEGRAPLSVQFTDNSTGSIASWLWEFGDAGYANTQNATHDYHTSDLYAVNLTVTGTDASTSKITKNVAVHPNASFSYSPASGPAPLTVQFHDTSQGSPTAWYWEFWGMDTMNSTSKDPLVTFPYAGSYEIYLNATGGHGLSDEAWDYGIDVYPAASFTASPLSGDGPLTVQFNDTSRGMWPVDPTNPIMALFGNRYYWDFGDGSTSNERNPVHVFHNTSTVTLTAAVQYMTNTSAPLQITVGPSPNVDFTASPVVGVAPLHVSFTDTSKGVSPLSYNWSFGDNTTSMERNPVHTFTGAGTYHVNLTVTDGGGKTGQKSRDIQATLMPGPFADFAASPRSGAPPLTVDFIDQSAGAGPLTYLWDFGDNSTHSDRFLKNPVHTYQTANNFTVSLTVTDINNQTSNKVATDFIRVGSSSLGANFTVNPETGFAPLEIACQDTSTGSPTSWFWKVFWWTGSGYQLVNTSNLQSPSFSLEKPGPYKIELQVSNAQGSAIASRENAVHVLNSPPVAAFTASTFNGNVSIPIQFTDQSTGAGITQWLWDFGEGGASPYQNPVYTYLMAGTFNVTLTVTNDGGSSNATHQVTITGEVPSGDSIVLYPGWNHVSVPKELGLGNATAGVVFAGVNTGHRSILMYDGNTTSWEIVSSGRVLRPLESYWVFSTANTIVPLQFAFVSPTPSRQLYKGWNGMGFSGLTPRSANLTLQSLGTTWTYVQGFNGMTQSPEEVIVRGSTDPVYSDNRVLYPAHGYWVYLTDNGVLQGMA